MATKLAEAIELFNSGEFYACHDALEALWVDAPVDEKKFYQGLLQIAVACHHLGNKNWRGATVLLGEGRFRLTAYEPAYCPDGQHLTTAVDVQRLRRDAQELLTVMQAIGKPESNVAQAIDQLLMEISTGQRHYPQVYCQ